MHPTYYFVLPSSLLSNFLNWISILSCSPTKNYRWLLSLPISSWLFNTFSKRSWLLVFIHINFPLVTTLYLHCKGFWTLQVFSCKFSGQLKVPIQETPFIAINYVAESFTNINSNIMQIKLSFVMGTWIKLLLQSYCSF